MVATPANWGAFGALVFVVVSIGFLILRGYLVPRRTVDALLDAKDAQINAKDALIAASGAEADEWRHAWKDDHDLVVVMSGQVGELLTASQGSADALKSLAAEAQRNRR